jgi:hypothetical protein
MQVSCIYSMYWTFRCTLASFPCRLHYKSRIIYLCAHKFVIPSCVELTVVLFLINHTAWRGYMIITKGLRVGRCLVLLCFVNLCPCFNNIPATSQGQDGSDLSRKYMLMIFWLYIQQRKLNRLECQFHIKKVNITKFEYHSECLFKNFKTHLKC